MTFFFFLTESTGTPRQFLGQIEYGEIRAKETFIFLKLLVDLVQDYHTFSETGHICALSVQCTVVAAYHLGKKLGWGL